LSVKCLWLQEGIRKGWFETEKWPTETNKADLGTKILSKERFDMLKQLSGIVSLATLGTGRRSRFRPVLPLPHGGYPNHESLMVARASAGKDLEAEELIRDMSSSVVEVAAAALQRFRNRLYVVR